jgi:hypothetical protein
MKKMPFAVSLLCTGILLLGLVGMAQANLTDLALTGTATQSSTYPWSPTLGAANAIDGNTDGSVYHGSVTHTLEDLKAWWQVDLKGTHAITSIVIWNRTPDPEGSVMDRLSNFSVSVADSQHNTVWTDSYYTSGGYPNPSLTITLPTNTSGEFVKVQLNGTNYLSLAEVQVYGSNPVPEPATMLLLGLGVVGVAGIRRKIK